MTHELKTIVQEYEKGLLRGERAVLATVVALDGSSYRRPGVRMLIFENGTMVGAVSGGCVEKEVARQAESVFSTKVPKVMVYDGRYRLGCEGVLYILLEIFNPDKSFMDQFWETIKSRQAFQITSSYGKAHGENEKYRTVFHFGNTSSSVDSSEERGGGADALESFEQEMQPCFQLMILGAEHDAVQLCKFAAITGWEVTVVASPKEEKSEADFPGIQKLIHADPEVFRPQLDQHTAVVIMTHSFVKDLQFLISLKNEQPTYLGLLGPLKRREKLYDELLERYPDVSEDFLEQVHGPAGIDIGAETPQEIALSVLSEILTVVNQKEPVLLKDKIGKIHV